MSQPGSSRRRPEALVSGRRRLSLAGRRRGEAWLFLAPSLLFFVLLFAFPLGYGVFMSTTDFTTGTFFTGKAPYVGLSNFLDVIHKPLFTRAALNTLLIAGVSVVVELVAGLALALLFTRRFPGSRWLPTLILIPWLLPSVVVGTIWKWLLSGDGAINGVLGAFQLPTDAWLADQRTAIWAIIGVSIWGSIPYWTTILAAALKQVPDDQLEAAQLDGAGAWQRLVHIIVPAIWPVISVLVVMSVVYSLLIVDLVLVLTGGGPANSTATLGLLSYQSAFKTFQFGDAGAYGMLLLVISLAFAIVYTWLQSRRERGMR